MWHGGDTLRVRRGAALRHCAAARARPGVRRACGARRVPGRDGAGEGGGDLRGSLRAQADAARRHLADVADGGAGAPPRRDARYQFGLRERHRDGGPGGAGGRHRRPPCSCWAGSLPRVGRRCSRDTAEPSGPWRGRQGDCGRLAHDRRSQAGEALAPQVALCEVEGAGVYTLRHVASFLCNLFPRSAKDLYVLAQLRTVSLSFPDKKVLEDVSLTIYPGDRISLVGENGAGKTSMFRMLKGRLAPDLGEVSLARGVRIGYLEQDFAGMEEDPKRTCMEVALESFGPLIEFEKRIETLASELGEAGESERTSELLDDLGEAQQRLEVSGGYGFRARTQSTLTGLGLSEAFWGHRVSELSAGQRVRLALARLLLEDHDLILFDEPTNHLDVPACEWLEGHLAGMDTAYVVASHDRRFLDAVSRKVGHLDRGELTLYSSDYTAFRQQLRQAEEEGWRRYEKSRKLARKLQRQAQDYERWSEAGAKKKRGAADKGFVGHKAAKVMKRSLVARRRMEEAVENARTEKPFEKDAIKIEFGTSQGRSLVRAENLVVGYAKERPLTGELSFDLWTGDRLCILGPNGCGKTALLRTALGEIPPLHGDVRLAPSSKVGYFDQDNRLVPPDLTALEAVLGTGRDETLVRTVMGRMSVRRETVNKKVAKLSSGERAKVLLAMLILGDNNLLVLDEPTNYLEIETQDVLLEALKDFPGGILFVSHDRYFLEVLATETMTPRF